MNVNEISNSLEKDNVDDNELKNNKTPSSSFSYLNSQDKDISLEDVPTENNVAVQLTFCEKQEFGNVNAFTNATQTSRPVSSEKQQEKSILEKFLTRPLNTSFNDLTQYNKMDNRKVEPLKINLHREPIKTVIKIPQTGSTESQQHSPKITIKPLKPPSTVQGNSETDLEQRSHKSHHKASFETTDVFKSIADSHSEPHIVPKLTIRNISHPSILSSTSSSNNECSVVPKLTIKLDHQSSQEFSSKLESHQSTKVHEKKNRQEEGMLTADGEFLILNQI